MTILEWNIEKVGSKERKAVARQRQTERRAVCATAEGNLRRKGATS